MSQKHSPEFKACALRLIEKRVRAEQCSTWIACTAVGETLGVVSPHTLRNWWKQRVSIAMRHPDSARGNSPSSSSPTAGESSCGSGSKQPFGGVIHSLSSCVMSRRANRVSCSPSSPRPSGLREVGLSRGMAERLRIPRSCKDVWTGQRDARWRER